MFATDMNQLAMIWLCLAPLNTAQSPDSAAIVALERRVEDAVVRRDVAFLDSIYAPTFRFKHSTGTLELRDQRMASLRRPQAANAPGRTISRMVDSTDVEVHGDVALSTGRIHVRRDGGNPRWQNYTVRYARVWRRHAGSGRWQLLTHHTTSESEGPPALHGDTTVRSYDGRTMPAEIIRVSVPENRANAARTITVAALRIPTTAQQPGRPIVFLMGGPGIPGTVMTPIPPYFTLFQSLRELADVIILDQRGLGRSEPAIDCPVAEAPPTDLFLRRERIVQLVRDRVASCANELRSRGIDPTAYNTIESADDIDDLRQVLGVEQIDLLAFSYGSRLALMYVQRHGGHVGRVVLQGVNGPGLVLKRPAPFARKLERMTEVLEQDSSWQGQTDLRAAARAARARLARSPARVGITDRRTGRKLDVVVGRDGFDALVALNPDDARLPALLVSVAARDDRVLARFAEAAWNGLAGGTAGLMARAVNCAADRSRARWEQVRAESASAPFGSPIDNEFLTTEFCRAAGYAAAPVEFADTVTSAVPLLLLTGSLDATNPLENAVQVARGFPNAVSLEIANAAHEALPVPAVQSVFVDWFRGADVRGRQIAAPLPRFQSVAEAAAPAPERGR